LVESTFEVREPRIVEQDGYTLKKKTEKKYQLNVNVGYLEKIEE